MRIPSHFVFVVTAISPIALVLAFGTTLFSQAEPLIQEYVCSQLKDIRDQLMHEAERAQFNVRYVEFVGPTYTRGREFFKRSRLGEGDIFTRKGLEASVKEISKMKTIYPITMDSVEVKLERTDRTINIIFCVRQRPK